MRGGRWGGRGEWRGRGVGRGEWGGGGCALDDDDLVSLANNGFLIYGRRLLSPDIHKLKCNRRMRP